MPYFPRKTSIFSHQMPIIDMYLSFQKMHDSLKLSNNGYFEVENFCSLFESDILRNSPDKISVYICVIFEDPGVQAGSLPGFRNWVPKTVNCKNFRCPLFQGRPVRPQHTKMTTTNMHASIEIRHNKYPYKMLWYFRLE